MRDQIKRKFILSAMVGAVAGVVACTGSSSDSVTVEGDVAIAYVKRPVSALGNPTDAVVSGQGGDLYLRDKSSPSGAEPTLPVPTRTVGATSIIPTFPSMEQKSSSLCAAGRRELVDLGI